MTLTNYHYLKYNLIHDLDKNTLNYSVDANIKNIISAVIWGIKDNTSRFIGHEVQWSAMLSWQLRQFFIDNAFTPFQITSLQV